VHLPSLLTLTELQKKGCLLEVTDVTYTAKMVISWKVCKIKMLLIMHSLSNRGNSDDIEDYTLIGRLFKRDFCAVVHKLTTDTLCYRKLLFTFGLCCGYQWSWKQIESGGTNSGAKHQNKNVSFLQCPHLRRHCTHEGGHKAVQI